MPDAKKRCPWPGEDADYIRYHDEEWGVPVHDDRRMFEFLILEGAQAGLSWLTILRKRENYRAAFADFDPAKVARFGDKQIAKLLENPGIVRNRLKVNSAVVNARAFLDLAARHGSFCNWLWGFVDGKPIKSGLKRLEDAAATTPLSDKISKELKRLGFKFVGSTIVYSHLQATGLVNDHLTNCFRYHEV